MIPWTVEWSTASRKDLKRLDAATLERIQAAVRRLAENGLGDVKNLRDRPGYRLRVGDWRVLFQRDTANRTIRVDRVRNRGEAY